jgi:hypothetical protein
MTLHSANVLTVVLKMKFLTIQLLYKVNHLILLLARKVPLERGKAIIRPTGKLGTLTDEADLPGFDNVHFENVAFTFIIVNAGKMERSDADKMLISRPIHA